MVGLGFKMSNGDLSSPMVIMSSLNIVRLGDDGVRMSKRRGWLIGSRILDRECESFLEDGALAQYHDPVLIDLVRSCAIFISIPRFDHLEERNGCEDNHVGRDIENWVPWSMERRTHRHFHQEHQRHQVNNQSRFRIRSARWWSRRANSLHVVSRREVVNSNNQRWTPNKIDSLIKFHVIRILAGAGKWKTEIYLEDESITCGWAMLPLAILPCFPLPFVGSVTDQY